MRNFLIVVLSVWVGWLFGQAVPPENQRIDLKTLQILKESKVSEEEIISQCEQKGLKLLPFEISNIETTMKGFGYSSQTIEKLKQLISSSSLGSILERLARLEMENYRLRQQVSILEKFEGFSYWTVGYKKPAGWQNVVCQNLDFNTFSDNFYDVALGQFTAPKNGYYEFSSHGWGTATNETDQRLAIGFQRNGSLVAFSGGQLSQVDSPMPHSAHIMYLKQGDKVRITMYTTIDITLGAHPGGGHEFWFQGRYLGK